MCSLCIDLEELEKLICVPYVVPELFVQNSAHR